MQTKNQTPENPIGIFDSGIGGLTVLRAINKSLPGENIIYLGDTARVPYGIRSAETVIKYAISNAGFLLKQQIKLLVIACNTASAVATEVLRKRYDLPPIVEVINPGARGAVSMTKKQKVGIIATEATIKSKAYQAAIKALNAEIEVFTRYCPLFVPFAEEGWCSLEDEIVLLTTRRYLEPLKAHGIDTLVLGCTHYPLLKGVIQHIMGEEVALIDSAEETAREVSQTLNDMKMKNNGSGDGHCSFFLTDIPNRFTKMAKLFLGKEIQNVKLIDILEHS